MNVRDMATSLDLCDVIERAILFDSRLVAVWSLPVEYKSFKGSYGRGGPTQYGIKLHPGLQTNAAALRKVFLHELAHCMEYICHRNTGHSATFWEAMIRLGERPWERHDYHGFSIREYESDRKAAAYRELEKSGL